MSAPKVDVLATLRRHRADCAVQDCNWCRELDGVIAAMDEFIQKADTVATAMSNLIAARQVDLGYGQYVTDLTGALARIRGAA